MVKIVNGEIIQDDAPNTSPLPNPWARAPAPSNESQVAQFKSDIKQHQTDRAAAKQAMADAT